MCGVGCGWVSHLLLHGLLCSLLKILHLLLECSLECRKRRLDVVRQLLVELLLWGRAYSVKAGGGE